MTVRYPAGSGVSLPAQPEPKKDNRNGPRRKTEPGKNSQYAVSQPDKDSPLHAFVAFCETHGWSAEIIKFPCMCEDWTDRAGNSVVIWRGMVHHSWCVCQVRKMSQEEIARILA